MVGFFSVNLPRQQVGRDPIALTTVRGERTRVFGPSYHHTSGFHQPAGLGPAHRSALCLPWLGHTTTPVTVPCLRRHRLHLRSPRQLMTFRSPNDLALHSGVQSTPTHVQHLTPYCHWPLPLVLHHQGIPQLGSLTQKRMAFFNISRSRRRRLTSSRRCRSSLGSRVRRPWPGKAAGGLTVYACFHRRNIWT